MKYLYVIVLFLIATGCKDCKENVNPNCEDSQLFCSTEPQVINGQLSIKFINHDLATPEARYSLLFKADFDNQPLTDLTTGDIVVRDNGEIIQYESDNQLIPDTKSFAFNVLLLADMSESITDANALPKVKLGMKSFVDAIIPDNSISAGETKIAIYYFDGDPGIKKIQDFSSDKNSLLQTIDNIDSSLTEDNSTNLYGAFRDGAKLILETVNNSDKLADLGALVVFTDGTDLANLESKANAQTDVNNLDTRISVFSIGLGDDIDENILGELGKNGFFFSEDIDQLTPTFQQIGVRLNNEVNSYYKMEYCSPRRAGQTTIETVITRNGNESIIETCINSDCTPDPC